ncbi:unnamed protein product [Caenorhabditis bovis]|uniref:Ig-like domain-containing protein n=1 Tax=Caenorhabditis bovis TaxID=2654633 RepID=A0A8S1EFV8_9PELO|nr:unnamed protein product [Caenorhabditis bovis]
MQIVIIIASIVAIVNCGEHILRLQDDVHAGTTLIGVELGTSVVIRCEHPNKKIDSIRWLHGGMPIDPTYVKMNKEASFVEITNYVPENHDGVYECSAPGMSASYRLKGEKNHVLPEGFRYCYGEELANCDHAEVCHVEISSNITSCVCEQGWMGASCNVLDSVRTHSVVTQPVCAYWPPFVTFLIFISVVVLLAYCLYKFKVRNPNRYSKNISRPPLVSSDYKPVGKTPIVENNGLDLV